MKKNRHWLDDFTTLMVITAVYWINVFMIFTVISAQGYVFYLFLIARIPFNSSFVAAILFLENLTSNLKSPAQKTFVYQISCKSNRNFYKVSAIL